MKTFFVVAVRSEKSYSTKVSQDGFFTYKDALKFVLNRGDKPIRLDAYTFASDQHTYTIVNVSIKRGVETGM